MESWYDPAPKLQPKRWPREQPKITVPSFVGESGQVLNMLMCQGAGDVARDYSGRGNHGTISGASWVDGPYGWALKFVDAESDYVDVADFSWGYSDSFSIGFWMKHDLPSGTATGIMGKPNWEWEFYWDGTHVDFRYYDTGGFETLKLNNLLTGGGGEWHQVFVTYNGGTHEGKAYVDGSDTGVSDTSGGDHVDRAMAMRVGESYEGYYNGLILLVRVYDGRVLTESKIKSDFEATKQLFG